MTDYEWTKEYIEHRDRLAEETCPGHWQIAQEERVIFRTGFDAGAKYERERSLQLVEEIRRLEALHWAEFHRRVCLQSRGCHCKGIKNEVLDRYEAGRFGSEITEDSSSR